MINPCWSFTFINKMFSQLSSLNSSSSSKSEEFNLKCIEVLVDSKEQSQLKRVHIGKFLGKPPNRPQSCSLGNNIFLMIYWIFFSPQVKRIMIISNKDGLYELPHELRNNLKLRKYQEDLRSSQNYSLVPSLPPKMRTLSILTKNCSNI